MRAGLGRMMRSPSGRRSRIQAGYPCAPPFGLPSSVPAREAVRRSGRRLVRPAGYGRDGVPKARVAVAGAAPAQGGVLVA